MVEGVFLAVKETVRQLEKDGRICEETQKAVIKELMPQDAYYKAAQEMMEQVKTEMGKWESLNPNVMPAYLPSSSLHF